MNINVRYKQSCLNRDKQHKLMKKNVSETVIGNYLDYNYCKLRPIHHQCQPRLLLRNWWLNILIQTEYNCLIKVKGGMMGLGVWHAHQLQFVNVLGRFESVGINLAEKVYMIQIRVVPGMGCCVFHVACIMAKVAREQNYSWLCFKGEIKLGYSLVEWNCTHHLHLANTLVCYHSFLEVCIQMLINSSLTD